MVLAGVVATLVGSPATTAHAAAKDWPIQRLKDGRPLTITVPRNACFSDTTQPDGSRLVIITYPDDPKACHNGGIGYTDDCAPGLEDVECYDEFLQRRHN